MNKPMSAMDGILILTVVVLIVLLIVPWLVCLIEKYFDWVFNKFNK